MQSNRTLFFTIIGLAIAAVIGMFLARLFLAESLNLPPVQQKIAIRVVVAPSIKPWVDQAAQEFNRNNPNTQIELIASDSLIPETQFTSNPQRTPPAAWLAEASFVVDMARNNGLQFNDARSVASTSLAWGAFNNRLEEFTQEYGGLTWEAVHQSAIGSDSTLKLVIAAPNNTAEGLAALISAATAHLNTQALTEADARSAEPWLTETLKESARGGLTLGPKPAEAFATRGASIGDAGMLALASWHNAGLQNRPDFSIMPAQSNARLDYPLAIWNGSQATPESQQAATAFRDFLLSSAQQSKLAEFSLEIAGTDSPNGVQVEGAAALALLRWAERELR